MRISIKKLEKLADIFMNQQEQPCTCICHHSHSKHRDICYLELMECSHCEQPEWENECKKILSEFASELLVLDSFFRRGQEPANRNVAFIRKELDEKMIAFIRSHEHRIREELVEKICGGLPDHHAVTVKSIKYLIKKEGK